MVSLPTPINLISKLIRDNMKEQFTKLQKDYLVRIETIKGRVKEDSKNGQHLEAGKRALYADIYKIVSDDIKAILKGEILY